MNRAKGTPDEYHPHFHCIFLMRKKLNLKKYIINRFSFDNTGKRSEPAKFSKFEVFLQKLWYCLYEGIPATKKNVDNAEGYSVKVETCPKSRYHQVFKYAVGGLFKKGNLDILSNESDLYNLDNALHKRKMIQGYGAFRKLKFDDEEVENEKDRIYEILFKKL